MKTRIRTTSGAYMTVKAARREVKRGHARWSGDRIEIIKTDAGNIASIAVNRTPTPHKLVPLVPTLHKHGSEPYSSLNPMIGYNMRSKGAGKQVAAA